MNTTDSFNPLALATDGVQQLKAYAPGKPIEELERELGISNIIKLASNENPMGPSNSALLAATSAQKGVWLYPDGNAWTLKQALAKKLGRDPLEIVIGNGSSEVQDMLCRVFIKPGSKALFSEHAFAMYPISTRAAGGDCVVVPAVEFGHDLPAMAIAANADDAVRVIFIANPNNPTGTWLTETNLRSFMQSVAQDKIVVLDEAYFEYVDEAEYPDGMTLLDEYPNLIVTRTFSKAYGLAGFRIGYGVCRPDIADLINRLRLPFNGNTGALAAAEAALADEAHVKSAVQTNAEALKVLEAGCEQLGLAYVPSVGNFLLINVGRDGQWVFAELLKRGIIVRALGGDLASYIRVSTGLPEQNERFISALTEILALEPAIA